MQPLKLCSICNNLRKLWKSKPATCYSCARVGFKPIPVSKKAIAKSSHKKELTNFFTQMIGRMPERCENCLEAFGFIPAYQVRWHIAHILPKQPDYGFPSVATEADNVMFLCVDCHANWDRKNAAERRKMPCYPIAVERVAKVYYLLSDIEQVRLMNYL
jgi:hypothetical protein